jgi:hypothetical protein
MISTVTKVLMSACLEDASIRQRLEAKVNRLSKPAHDTDGSWPPTAARIVDLSMEGALVKIASSLILELAVWTK